MPLYRYKFRIIDGKKIYFCDKCDYKTHSNKSLSQHNIRYKGIPHQKRKRGKNKDKTKNKKFVVKKINNKDYFYCEVCDKYYSGRGGLTIHKRTKTHKKLEDSQNGGDLKKNLLKEVINDVVNNGSEISNEKIQKIYDKLFSYETNLKKDLINDHDKFSNKKLQKKN